MMIDISRMEFGSWSTISHIGKISTSNEVYWLCRCKICGREKPVSSYSLRSGKSKSCGCSRMLTHGHARNGTTSREWKTWSTMKSRCLNPNSENYGIYGGIGITVCKRWIDSFEDFLSDVGLRPLGKTLDRIDGRKGYEPGNVRWATPSEQALNRKTTVSVVSSDGIEFSSMRIASEYYKIHESTVKKSLSLRRPTRSGIGFSRP